MAGQGVGEGRLSRRRPGAGGAVVGQDHRRMRTGPRRRDRLPREHPGTLAQRDRRLPRHGRFQRSHRGTEPMREEGEAVRARVPDLQALPPPGAAPRRRHHLAEPASTTTHPDCCSPLRRVEPLIASPVELAQIERPAGVAGSGSPPPPSPPPRSPLVVQHHRVRRSHVCSSRAGAEHEPGGSRPACDCVVPISARIGRTRHRHPAPSRVMPVVVLRVHSFRGSGKDRTQQGIG